MEFFKRNKNRAQSCIHTKNIFSLVDLTPKDESYAFLNLHVKSCSVCKNEYAKFTEQVVASQVFIPRPTMDKDLKESFDREMHDLLISFKLNEKVIKRDRWVNVFTQTNYFATEFFKSLYSKSMLIGLVTALAIFFMLRSH
jgi:hypothetical protein